VVTISFICTQRLLDLVEVMGTASLIINVRLLLFLGIVLVLVDIVMKTMYGIQWYFATILNNIKGKGLCQSTKIADAIF
jgi:hypothetical protein